MIPVDFDGFEARRFGASLTGVIRNEVPSGRHSCTVLFILFGADGTDDSSVRHSSVCRHLVLVDEVDGVGSRDAAFEALGQATEFVGAGDEPFGLVVGVGDEVSVLELATCFVMGDGKALVQCGLECRSVEREQACGLGIAIGKGGCQQTAACDARGDGG